MREIKFRLFTNVDKKMIQHEELMTMPIRDWINHPNLMQFTGLHDKNGKEIFEGDILKYDGMPHLYSIVEFFDAAFWACDRNGKTVIGEPKFVEVLGNIYENPELLESKP